MVFTPWPLAADDDSGLLARLVVEAGVLFSFSQGATVPRHRFLQALTFIFAQRCLQRDDSRRRKTAGARDQTSGA